MLGFQHSTGASLCTGEAVCTCVTQGAGERLDFETLCFNPLLCKFVPRGVSC